VVHKSRLVTHGGGIPRGSSPKAGSPKGVSPRGASPGGSPQKPPRAPGKGTLKHFFKAMTSKRPSQVDLRWAPTFCGRKPSIAAAQYLLLLLKCEVKNVCSTHTTLGLEVLRCVCESTMASAVMEDRQQIVSIPKLPCRKDVELALPFEAFPARSALLLFLPARVCSFLRIGAMAIP